jgi:hypothetical protein
MGFYSCRIHRYVNGTLKTCNDCMAGGGNCRHDYVYKIWGTVLPNFSCLSVKEKEENYE